MIAMFNSAQFVHIERPSTLSSSRSSPSSSHCSRALVFIGGMCCFSLAISLWILLQPHSFPVVVGSDRIVHGAITNSLLADGCVSTLSFQDHGVDGINLVNHTVGSDLVGDQAVMSYHIEVGAVTAPKIADSVVLQQHLALATVDTQQLAPGAVTSSTIQGGCVTSNHLADASVTPATIAAKNITGGHLQPQSVTSAILANASVGTTHLTTNSVSSSTIAPLAVSSSTNIQNGAITPSKIISNSLTNAQFQDASISVAKLAFATNTGILATDWTTTVTSDTLSKRTISYRRVGDSLQLTCKIIFFGSTGFSLPLPVPLAVDKITRTPSFLVSGYALLVSNTSTTYSYGSMSTDGTDGTRLVPINARETHWNTTYPQVIQSGHIMLMQATVPIEGWAYNS
eukprot:GILJ01022732.1.p1 GENE.GILJ01022732.1~~GILJ01022732.1.p1  ORF type:complete len:399 (+),score=42.47 GILJ01022732.1:56-1252(+)